MHIASCERLEYPIISHIQTTMRHAIFNHNFYWKSMSPYGGGMPTGELLEAILDKYGSFEEFMCAFEAVAGTHFGSGWAWLIRRPDDSVEVVATHDALNPVVERTGFPLLVCDIWEHAYYIDYRNRRGDYLDSWWEVVN